MQKALFFYFLLTSLFVNSQINPAHNERAPLFPDCNNIQSGQDESCFYQKLQDFVFQNFKLPNDLPQNYKGEIIVLFEVDKMGKFNIIYTDTDQKSLTTSCQHVFEKLPIIQPATFNGMPTYSKFTIRIKIPLEPFIPTSSTPNAIKRPLNELTELDQLYLKKFEKPLYNSHLNIPFSHSYYAQFEPSINAIGLNNHTASKPYSYHEVAPYFDFDKAFKAIEKKAGSWVGRKFWNENMVQIQGQDYWFTLNPVFDVQLGKSIEKKPQNTYQNTRAIQLQGGLGHNLNFTTTIYESQARFADYYNQLSQSLKPAGGNPAVVPGLGIVKEFGTNSFDMPSADAHLNFVPSKFMDFQLGYGRNFIGDGYRSLLEGDGSNPYPFFKINTKFWKIKYTNTYMWLKDVRNETLIDKAYSTKYMANHFLSWNVSNRLNLGFFESVVWSNTNGRGFDINFANPIVFYRTVEFASSSKAGNALLGFTAKYKYNNNIHLYSQFLIDEFSFSEIKAARKSWKNKWGYQLGAKYYNAFNINNLTLQLEYNHVRPYVYSHLDPLTNYGNTNLSMGHQWGGNFEELVAIARYHQGRWFANGQLTIGKRGMDFDTSNTNYGSNIYLSYQSNRPYNEGVTVGQGNKTTLAIAQLQAGYLINPATNIKLFGHLVYRNFNPLQDNSAAFKDTTIWFTFGIRSDIFNMYFDY